VDFCKKGHDVSDKKKSLYYRVDNRTNKVTTACKKCQKGCVDNLRAKQAKPRKLPISLLERDTCAKGHDIRDKDASLYIYVTSANTKNPNTTYLKCRECHKSSSRTYAYANGLVKQPRTNKVDWKAVRAKNDAENKARLAERAEQPPRLVKIAALGEALRNEIYALLKTYDDTELMELLLELRKRP
jgi:hypothetical protein